MTIQAEHGADGPPPCDECRGSGKVVIRGCSHRGNCPCGEDKAFPCPDCGGTGRGPCHCGEPADRLDAMTGQPVCSDCDRSEDGPMGGMGHQHDYAPALESGRGLK